mgnify:CR=1 FL=1
MSLFFQAEDGIRDLVRSRGLEMCIRDSFYATVGLAFAKWGDFVGKGGVLGIIAIAVAVALVVLVFALSRKYKEIEEEVKEVAE